MARLGKKVEKKIMAKRGIEKKSPGKGEGHFSWKGEKKATPKDQQTSQTN